MTKLTVAFRNFSKAHEKQFKEERTEMSYIYLAHLRQQEGHNSKFGIFELLVQKETFADALLTGILS
jgi:hypothetical protein